MCRTLSLWVDAISAYRVARRAQRYAGGREPRERRTGLSGSAQVTARRFDRERRPPDFAGVGSPEIGRQYATPIRARTEEPAFALSPAAIDRHKIRSRGSEADAQPRTGGSRRRGRRRPEPWRVERDWSKAWGLGPAAFSGECTW